MDRINVLANQVGAPPAFAANPCAAKSPDDVVICCAVRTPLAKAKRGGFAKTCPEEMLSTLLKAVQERTKLDPKLVGDVQIGNVLMPGSGAFTARQAVLMAGYPVDVPVMCINRQCSSGLQAVANVAAAIKAGHVDVGIGGGVESMSMFDMMGVLNPDKVAPGAVECEESRKCLIPMGLTSENVAEKYGIPRVTQDTLAAASHAKAVKAQKAGLYDSEIVPVMGRTAKGEKMVTKDEGMKEGTTVESLGKLNPAFKQGGTTTAGNSSQVTDGAAVVLMARRSVAEKNGLPILAKFHAFSVVGCPPEIMGIGPAVAIPAALKQAGMKVDDVDIWEINEAFASQATYSINSLKIPMEKVNPKGGAIALGHPLGATGARQIATLLPELKRTGKKVGCVSMCIGTGMGAAGIIISEQ
jgi:acetyl-CoA acyltransferase 1